MCVCVCVHVCLLVYFVISISMKPQCVPGNVVVWFDLGVVVLCLCECAEFYTDDFGQAKCVMSSRL